MPTALSLATNLAVRLLEVDDLAWMAPFLGGRPPNADLQAALAQARHGRRYLAHAASALREHEHVHAHAAHFVDGAVLRRFATRFRGRALVVQRREAHRHRLCTVVLDDDTRWEQLREDGQHSLDQSLADWLDGELRRADSEGLHLLRPPPCNREWLQRMFDPREPDTVDPRCERAVGSFVRHLEETGISLEHLRLRGPSLDTPSDAELEIVLGSMVARGALTQEPLVADIHAQRAAGVAARRALECERKRILASARGRLDTVRHELGDMRERIATGRRDALQALLARCAGDGGLRVDLNEFVLMLPSHVTCATLAAVSSGASASQLHGMRGALAFVMRHSPAPAGSAWAGARYTGGQTSPQDYAPRYEVNARVLEGYTACVDAFKLGDTTRYQRLAQAAGVLRRLEERVAPLSTNPLEAADGALLLDDLLLDLYRSRESRKMLTQRSGAVTWIKANLERVCRQQTHAHADAIAQRRRPAAEVRLPAMKLDGLCEPDRRAVEQARLLLQTYPARHPEDALSMWTLIAHQRDYAHFLSHLRGRRLTRELLEPQVLPEGHLARTWRAFAGATAAGEPADIRQALRELADAPVGDRRDPAGLSLELFLRLPSSLQSVLVDAATDRIHNTTRMAVARVHGLRLHGTPMRGAFAPRLAVHHDILLRVDGLALAREDRGLLRRLMHAVEQRWSPRTPHTVLDVVHAVPLDPELGHCIDTVLGMQAPRGAHGLASRSWGKLRKVVAALHVPCLPLLADNAQRLQRYIARLAPSQRTEAHAALLAWVQGAERRVRDIDDEADNPALDDVMRLDEDDFEREASRALRAAGVPEQVAAPHLRAFHRMVREDATAPPTPERAP